LARDTKFRKLKIRRSHMADEKDKKKKEDEKEEQGQTTLARFFGDVEEDIDTQVIDQAKQYAHRMLGRGKGRPMLNALERLEKKRRDEREKADKEKAEKEKQKK
jgi:hypothetical protein